MARNRSKTRLRTATGRQLFHGLLEQGPDLMRICFICNEYPPARHGGIGTLTRTLARALVQAGNQVRVVGFCSEKEVAPEMETDCGVSVHRFKISCRPLEWVRARYFLYTIVRRWAQEG